MARVGLVLTVFTALPFWLPSYAVATPEGSLPAVQVQSSRFRLTLSADGVLIPAAATRLSFVPRAFAGRIAVVEVAPHGRRVQEGDVVLRLDAEAIENQIREAKWSLQTAQLQLKDQRERAKIYEVDSRAALELAARQLEWTEKGIKGYFDVERPMAAAYNELNAERFRHAIDDRKDELTQLETMYKEDELTEETEEIVLKRARRELSMVEKQFDLFRQYSTFRDEYLRPQQDEQIRGTLDVKRRTLRDVRLQAESKAQLIKIELDRAEHRLALARRKLERLEEDRKLFTVRAPHDGIVLHGDIARKTSVAELRVGQRVSPGTPILTLAREGALKARFKVPPNFRYHLRAGLPVTVVSTALPRAYLHAQLEPLELLPASDGSWAGHATFSVTDPRLLPLLSCKVSIVAVDIPDSLAVPVAAIFAEGPEMFCYVKPENSDTIIRRRVVLGPDDGRVVVVREGLRRGDSVFLKKPDMGRSF